MPMEYSIITENLYVGMQPDLDLKDELAALGITASVNLRDEYDDEVHGLTFSRYCYLPTVDEKPPVLEDLQKGVDFIADVIDQGGKVYIHCAAGVGRAPTMAAAYLISQGFEVEDAIRTIHQKRPIIALTKDQFDVLVAFADGLADIHK